MSLERPVDLECPNCALSQTIVIWDSLNADVSPEARKALFEGKINVFICEVCGHQALIPVPLLYHDMKRRFVVQYFPFEAIGDDDFLRRFGIDGTDRSMVGALAGLPAGTESAMDYMRRAHIVFDMGELVRYVLFREQVFDARREVDSTESS